VARRRQNVLNTGRNRNSYRALTGWQAERLACAPSITRRTQLVDQIQSALAAGACVNVATPSGPPALAGLVGGLDYLVLGAEVDANGRLLLQL